MCMKWTQWRHTVCWISAATELLERSLAPTTHVQVQVQRHLESHLHVLQLSQVKAASDQGHWKEEEVRYEEALARMRETH